MGNQRTAPIPSHWSCVRAVKWARNWKILKILDATSDFQEYQNKGLFQVAGKAGAKKEPFPSPTPTAGQCRRQSGKAIGNTWRTQVVLCSAAYQAVAHLFALSERQTSQPPAKRQSFLFLRVTSTVKGESAWKCVGQHCARTGQGKTSTSLQQEINYRNRCISHWLCIVNAPRPRELTSPPASHNLASGRPSHTVPQPFPRTRYICHRLHGGLVHIATGAAITKAKDIQFLVTTTVLLFAHISFIPFYNEHHTKSTQEHSILRGNKPPLS